jgi:hypothetical protein
MSIGTKGLRDVPRVLVFCALLACGAWALAGCGNDAEVGFVLPPPESTPTGLPTLTPPKTFTPLPSFTPTNSPTRTKTSTPTGLPTATITATGTISGTPTKTKTPRNTATITWTPTATKTPTNTRTPTSTRTPQPAPSPGTVVLAVNDAEAEENGPVVVLVSLDTAGKLVAYVEHNLLFDSTILQLVEPASDCELNPDLGVGEPGCIESPQVGPCKTLQRNLAICPGASGCPPGFTGKRLHATVASNSNSNAIPGGALYTCRFRVTPGFLGTTPVDSANAVAKSPSGATLAAAGMNGIVSIVEPPPPTPQPSNCCTDRSADDQAGCDDDNCADCVCNVPESGAFCCAVLWDATCADIAHVECAAECQCVP